MNRRAFVAGLGVLLAAPCETSAAQSSGQVAFLCTGSCSNLPNAVSPVDQAFVKALDAGFQGGRSITFDMRGTNVAGTSSFPTPHGGS